jgi:hypothetical protein
MTKEQLEVLVMLQTHRELTPSVDVIIRFAEAGA